MAFIDVQPDSTVQKSFSFNIYISQFVWPFSSLSLIHHLVTPSAWARARVCGGRQRRQRRRLQFALGHSLRSRQILNRLYRGKKRGPTRHITELTALLVTFLPRYYHIKKRSKCVASLLFPTHTSRVCPVSLHHHRRRRTHRVYVPFCVHAC